MLPADYSAAWLSKHQFVSADPEKLFKMNLSTRVMLNRLTQQCVYKRIGKERRFILCHTFRKRIFSDLLHQNCGTCNWKSGGTEERGSANHADFTGEPEDNHSGQLSVCLPRIPARSEGGVAQPRAREAGATGHAGSPQTDRPARVLRWICACGDKFDPMPLAKPVDLWVSVSIGIAVDCAPVSFFATWLITREWRWSTSCMILPS